MSWAIGHWLWISLGQLLADTVPLKDATEEHLGHYRREEVEKMVDVASPLLVLSSPDSGHSQWIRASG